MLLDKKLSSEFVLTKHLNGIKLLSPKNHKDVNVISSISQIINLPYSVYIVSKHDSLFMVVNEQCAKLLAVLNQADLLQKNVTSFTDSHSAKVVMGNDKKVITNLNTLIIEEEADLENDIHHVHCLTLKKPCYNEYNELIGVFGISVPVNESRLAQCIMDLARLGFLPAPSVSMHTDRISRRIINDALLSRREKEILVYVRQGLSAKMIAETLYLSKRTVEHHIENIKYKTGAQSKYDLLDLNEGS